MLAHLWIGPPSAPAPLDYVEMTICREFGCLPSALRAEPLETVYHLQVMLAAEAKVRERKQQANRRGRR